MRRDITLLLERWGNWARYEEYCRALDWKKYGLILPVPGVGETPSPTCSDSDGMMIDACIARLHQLNRREAVLILGLYYLARFPQQHIAEKLHTSRDVIKKSLIKSEAFIEGCLAALDIPLDMDAEMMPVCVSE